MFTVLKQQYIPCLSIFNSLIKRVLLSFHYYFFADTKSGIWLGFGIPRNPCIIFLRNLQVTGNTGLHSFRRIKQLIFSTLKFNVRFCETVCPIRRIHIHNIVAPCDAGDIIIDSEKILTRFMKNQSFGKTAVNWHRTSLSIAPCSELYIIAINDGVIFHHSAINLIIPIDRRVRHAVHDDKSSTKTRPLNPFKIIITDRLMFINDADTSRMLNIISKKHIAFNQIVTAVAHRQSAA